MNKITDTESLSKAIRLHALEMTHRGKSSHIASIFSSVDLLAVLYGRIMNHDPKNPKWPDRDRFILSKGHAGAGVYATLAEMGYFPKEKLKTHYQDGSDLSGHVSHKGISGVEVSTGSLGHGLSIGAGMAYYAKLEEKKHRVFVLLSDGEFNEGSTWEAILFSAKYKLNNLVAVIDYNKYQSLGLTEETIGLEPFEKKLLSFNWIVEVVNGHDHNALENAFNNILMDKEKPKAILAKTIKGKGVSFMENDPILWHYRSAQGEEYDRAKEELRN